MTRKLSKYEENRLSAEENINEAVVTNTDKTRSINALIRIGEVGAIGRLANNLTAQTIRALQIVRDNKDFESLGFKRFDNFLDESPVSPMSYRQFIDREKLLAQEGDFLFDLLNDLRLSHKQRRLLGAGNVQVDEEKGTVIVTASVGGVAEAVKTEEIDLQDRARLLQTLSALADQNSTLNETNIKQRQKIERGEKDVDDLKRKLDEAKSKPGERSIEQLHFDNFIRVVNSIDAMAATIKEFNPEDKAKHQEVYLDAIDGAILRLRAAYNKDAAPVSKRHKKVSAEKSEEVEDFADLAASMNDDELANLME
ncbi:hypothetical protein Bpfe_031018 [Biomphalaria pfeifferi]|uniref:Uncharacterized protein n=1 Tax=Biomphalaria pfeifferi TaxID=112525 RepID=A0AAD8APQ0_BIOPF|nr:hypothetical protein Bpfe_031018 [Biomphalaria pfeifferi]